MSELYSIYEFCISKAVKTKRLYLGRAHLNCHSRFILLKVALRFNFHGFGKENVTYSSGVGKLILQEFGHRARNSRIAIGDVYIHLQLTRDTVGSW